MRYAPSAVILFIVLTSIYGSGCIGTDPGEAVNATVVDFMNAIDEGEYATAFAMYEGIDFLVPASVKMAFSNNGFVKNSLNEITLTDQNITGNLAVVTADCTLSEYSLAGREVGQLQKKVYFRLQKTEIGWIITKVAFNKPIVLSEGDLIEIEVARTPIDTLADNAPIIFIAAVLMFGAGIYLNRKEKAAKAKPVVIDLTNATPMQKESIAQYVRFVPSPQYVAGKRSTIDVWVKNFAQQPYENFAVTGTFPTSLEVKDINLFFGTIAPGETVKQTWVVKPKVTGWIPVNEPTVVFEYMGIRYMGELDPVWIQVQ